MLHLILLTALIAPGPLAGTDDQHLDAYLRETAAAGQTFAERLNQAARDALGTAYQDGPLGEGPQGKFDTDPLVDFTKADCVTYVEQSLAIATASDYDQMLDNLQRIRYKDGQIDFEHRNHFMISDWVANNAFSHDITDTLGVDTQEITRTISRRGFFNRVNAPGLGDTAPDQKITLSVVPTDQTPEAEAALPGPALIVFVGKVDWLFSLHCGLYMRDGAGHGKLYHASSKAGEVVAMDLADYMRSQSDRYIGFTAYRLDRPPFDTHPPRPGE